MDRRTKRELRDELKLLHRNHQAWMSKREQEINKDDQSMRELQEKTRTEQQAMKATIDVLRRRLSDERFKTKLANIELEISNSERRYLHEMVRQLLGRIHRAEEISKPEPV